jgi:hypothetical protein
MDWWNKQQESLRVAIEKRGEEIMINSIQNYHEFTIKSKI